VALDPVHENQRPALLLNNGVVDDYFTPVETPPSRLAFTLASPG
jgi:hypothetical protein